MNIKGNVKGWAIVIVSFLIMAFIFATCISCMGVYVKPVTEELEVPRMAYTMTITIMSLMMIPSAMAAGKLFEKHSIKKLMLLGTVLCSAAMFVLSSAPSIGFFYIAGAMMGIALQFTCNIPISILIKNWFDEKIEGLALGIAFVGSGVGAMMLNPLYTFIIESYGWRISFAIAGLSILIVLVPLIAIVIRDCPAEHFNISPEYAAEGIGNTPVNDFTLGEALRKKETWALFLGYIVLSLICMAILNHGIPFLTDCGMSPAKAASMISVGSAILIFGKIGTGILSDKFGVKKITVIQAIIMSVCAVSLWMSGVTQYTVFIIGFILLYGIGAGTATMSPPLVLPLIYGKTNFSSLMGMFNMASSIGGVLQVVISLAYDTTGSYNCAWAALTILSVIAVMIFITCIKPLQKLRGKQ